MKIQTLSLPQDDRLCLIFVKDINISIHILIRSKITTYNANLMHHPLSISFFFDNFLKTNGNLLSNCNGHLFQIH